MYTICNKKVPNFEMISDKDVISFESPVEYIEFKESLEKFGIDTYKIREYQKGICVRIDFDSGVAYRSTRCVYVGNGYNIIKYKEICKDLTNILLESDDLESVNMCISDLNDIRERLSKRKWTEEEISAAKEISHKIILELYDNFVFPVFYQPTDNNIMVDIDFGHNFGKDRNYKKTVAYANCSKNDEYNVEIGRCVALCKATGKPIPEFIMRKK